MLSEYTFPFEGNWNAYTETRGPILAKRLWIHFPVWRELKQTQAPNLATHCGGNSEYTFPFEGNWNIKQVSLSGASNITLWIHFPVWRELKPMNRINGNHLNSDHSEYTFPFEGNWNLKKKDIYLFFILTLNTLSRLKGIETVYHSFQPIHLYTLNTLSRLKGIETGFPVDGTVNPGNSLNTLSRLKGIETLRLSASALRSRYSEYTFPFEGNWNFSCVHLPTLPAGFHSEYTFPFEGNWNYYSDSETKNIFHSLNTLSRLKGIETILDFDDGYPERCNSEYTFPFEGNWNSRLNLMRIMLSSSEYTFPFEGNWNLIYR